jgi:hypothetical protein
MVVARRRERRRRARAGMPERGMSSPSACTSRSGHQPSAQVRPMRVNGAAGAAGVVTGLSIGHQDRAGSTERVAERDRAAVGVGLLQRGAGVRGPGEQHGGERLVDLEHVDVADAQVALLAPAPARPPRCRPLPGTDQAPARPRRTQGRGRCVHRAVRGRARGGSEPGWQGRYRSAVGRGEVVGPSGQVGGDLGQRAGQQDGLAVTGQLP